MASKGFGGTLQSVQLPDAIQLICMSGRTAALSVSVGLKRGVLFFDKGELIHAVHQDLKGEDAFYEIIGWVGGEFALAAISPGHERTIFDSWEAMLLEVARRSDEANIPKDDVTDTAQEEEPAEDVAESEPPNFEPESRTAEEDESDSDDDLFDFSDLESGKTDRDDFSDESETPDSMTLADESDPDEDVEIEVELLDESEEDKPSVEVDDTVTEMFDSFDKLESQSSISENDTETSTEDSEDAISDVATFNAFETDSDPDDEDDIDHADEQADDEELIEVHIESDDDDVAEIEDEDNTSESDEEGDEETEEEATPEVITDIEEEEEQTVAEEDSIEETTEEPNQESEEQLIEETAAEESTTEDAVEEPSTVSDTPKTEVASGFVSEESIGRSLDTIVETYMETWTAEGLQVRFDAIDPDILPEHIYNHFLCRFLQVAMKVIRLDDMPFDFTSEELNEEIRKMYQVLRDNWLITKDYYRQVIYDANYFDLTRSVDPARSISQFLYDRTENEPDQLPPFLKALMQNNLIGDHYEELWDDVRNSEDAGIHPRKVENFIRALLDRRPASESYAALRVAMQRLLNMAAVGVDTPPNAIGISLILTMLESRGLVNIADFVRVEQKIGKEALSLDEMDGVMERYRQYTAPVQSRKIKPEMAGSQSSADRQDIIFSLRKKS